MNLSLGDRRCDAMPDLVWDSVMAPITVLVYDDNFTRWAEKSGASADDETGVFGAFGVFGAATPKTFVLVVVPRGLQA